MMAFLEANLPTLAVGAVVFGLIALAAIKVIRDKRNHKGSCGCGCKSCPSAGACHTK